MVLKEVIKQKEHTLVSFLVKEKEDVKENFF